MGFYPFVAVSASSFKPWQFQPETYGAKGNGKILGDGVVNGTTTFTSASANFTSGDVGKTIMINGGNGTTSQPFVGTIATFTNSTTVTLSAAPSASASTCSTFYGSDDTAAINSCITAASNFAQGISGSGTGFGNYYAQIVFSSKLYCVAAAAQKIGDGSTVPTFYTQIPLPYPNANGSTQKLVLQLTGPAEAGNTQYFECAIPNLYGACLVTTIQPGSAADPTYGFPSVIGGPNFNIGYTGGFANVKPVIDNLTIVHGWGFQGTDLEFKFCAGAEVTQANIYGLCTATGNAPLRSTIPTAPGTSGTGLSMPNQGNNDDSYVNRIAIESVSGVGCAFSENFCCVLLECINCDIGIFVRSAGGTIIHGGTIQQFNCENTHTAIQAQASGSTQFPINIMSMITEIIDTSDITDSSAILTGIIHWSDFERTNMNVTGAGNLVIINDRLGPGHWAGAPGVPLTTVAQQNTSFREATVVITSGGAAVTAIAVDGTATGLTLGTSGAVTVRVPSGKNITLTYSSTAPTWEWTLD